MNKFIYLRKSCDWSNIESIGDYEIQNFHSRKLIKDWMPDLIIGIKIWNKIFNTSFFEMRQKIKKISYESICGTNTKIIHKNEAKDLLEKNDFLT